MPCHACMPAEHGAWCRRRCPRPGCTYCSQCGAARARARHRSMQHQARRRCQADAHKMPLHPLPFPPPKRNTHAPPAPSHLKLLPVPSGRPKPMRPTFPRPCCPPTPPHPPTPKENAPACRRTQVHVPRTHGAGLHSPKHRDAPSARALRGAAAQSHAPAFGRAASGGRLRWLIALCDTTPAAQHRPRLRGLARPGRRDAHNPLPPCRMLLTAASSPPASRSSSCAGARAERERVIVIIMRQAWRARALRCAPKAVPSMSS